MPRIDPDLKHVVDVWETLSAQTREVIQLIRDDDGIEQRLGLSFGHNPFTPEMAVGFVPPPVQPGPYTFGLHWVATKNGELTLYDQWYDGFQADETGEVESAVEKAKCLLNDISDEQYLKSFSTDHESGLLERALADDIVVIEGEVF